MQPTRTPTGYRIEPSRLVECLQFLYHWLPKEQWWHLYGDGRKYGKKDTVLMAISNINNEQKLNGVKFQSPKEMWPIQVFHQKDSRLNLELNIGDGHGGPGNGVVYFSSKARSFRVIGVVGWTYNCVGYFLPLPCYNVSLLMIFVLLVRCNFCCSRLVSVFLLLSCHVI